MLHVENGLLQKNPLLAENGEGWADLITKCLVVSINSSFCCANAHHRMKTNHSFSSESFLITASVKICHHASLWEFGVSFLTVNPAFNN